MSKFKITNIKATEILDSRGTPTVQVEVILKNGIVGVSKVPSGASTGKFEAHELRDNDKSRYFGKGVLKAVENVNTVIKDALLGKKANNQKAIDETLLALDGTKNKTKLGANALLGVSLAVAVATAKSKKIPLYKYLNSLMGEVKTTPSHLCLNNTNMQLPTPMCNILNGGAHADNSLDIQEFMIMPVGANTFTEAIRWCSEIFHTLKGLLKQKGYATSVGDEGGFAPNLKNHEQALDLILEAIKKAGYNTENEVKIAIDAAVSEWQNKTSYTLPKAKTTYTKKQLIDYWADLTTKYPIISLEDPLGETDYKAWTSLTKKIGSKVQVVGDDLFVTNKARLDKGIKEGWANAILIKVNQIGTLTETLETIKLAKENGFNTVVSHRSGETEDTFIADLAVATSTQIKTGSLSRSERMAKYNRLINIEKETGGDLCFAGFTPFDKKIKN